MCLSWLLLVALFVTACSPSDIPPATTTTPVPPSGEPVANAGPDQGNIALNTLITLNGSGSTNPSGTPLTYAWAFTSIPAGSTAVLVNPTNVSPTFTVDRAGDYVVQLIVNNGTVNSAVDFVTITTKNNLPPIANAGLDQGGKAPGSLVTLNGSASTDPDGNLLTYSWTLLTTPAGSTAVLSSTTSVTTTFVVDRGGSYTAQLIVNDGTVNSAPDSVIITSNNVAPLANAGPDQGNVAPNALVTLNGSGSGDANGDPLTYSWALISKPAGSAAILANAGSVTPTFTVDRDGNYIAQLIVNDGTVNSTPDTVMITSNNVAPTANAGPDKAAAAGTLVTLNGSGSSDANGDPITYSWAFNSTPSTSTAVLVNANSVSPSFTTDRAGDYVVQLIVNDGTVNSAADTVLITTGNVGPVANAGLDQGSKAPGSLITLNGSLSSDANSDPLTYSWTLTSKPAGSAAVLANPTNVSPTFTVDRAGDYTAQLIVNDGTVNSAPDSVIITTNNVAPVANAGADQLNIAPTTLITLNGNLSSDANGDPLTYSWSLTRPAGSAAVLSDSTNVSPTFTVDRAGDYIAQLIVHDGTVNSAPDSVLVRTNDAAPVANAGTDQTVPVCRAVSLNGSSSFDPNGVSPLSYNWTLPIKPSSTITTSNTPITSSVTLANPLTVNPSFTTPSIPGVPGITPTSGQNVADLVGLYTAQLTVSDGVVTSASDSVDVTAQETYIGTLATIQSTYQTQCLGCHFIGALGNPSDRNSSKQGLGVNPRFGNGLVHKGNTLNANQILDMCVFFQSH